MIDMETVQFIMMIDTLCEMSLNGIKPLSEIKKSKTIEDCIYYDDKNSIYNALSDETYFRAVSVMWNEDAYDEKDNIYWDEYIKTDSKYTVTVVTSEDDDPCVVVKCGKQMFFIQDGECSLI